MEGHADLNTRFLHKVSNNARKCLPLCIRFRTVQKQNRVPQVITNSVDCDFMSHHFFADPITNRHDRTMRAVVQELIGIKSRNTFVRQGAKHFSNCHTTSSTSIHASVEVHH